MKKIIFLIFYIILTSNNSFSQDKGNLALSFGPGIPFGHYASSDVTNKSSGLAKTGAFIDLSFQYQLYKNYGLIALLLGQTSSLNTQPIVDVYKNEIPDATWSATSKDWIMRGAFIGACCSFPFVNGKTSFNLRALVGTLHTSTPDVNITGKLNGGVAWVENHSTSASAPAYLVGFGFNLNLGSKVCLNTNFDFLDSTPKFKNVKATASGGATAEQSSVQTIETINIGVGIGLKL